MLADLRALRALQAEQERALREGDAERVERLCAEGGLILARMADAPAVADEVDAVRELTPRVLAAQERLETLASEMRRAVLDELRNLGPGREALAGYRPAPRDNSRLVDRAR